MQILVVDESEKKAWRKSRRVLGTMLFRRGSRTFTGRLSTEGLRDLVKSLKSIASKNTAIAVFQLTAHSEFELIARIGRTVYWGDEGWFANRVSTKITNVVAGYAPAEKLLRLLVRLAALFHDLGKGNDQFQAMLHSRAKHQHLRHELVSLLMLDQATADVPAVFQALATDTPTLFNGLSTSLPSTCIPTSGLRGLDTEGLANDLLVKLCDPTEAGLFHCIRYLVLTHHRPLDAVRAPAESENNYAARLRLMAGPAEALPSCSRQLNELQPDTTLDARNLTLSVNQPWHDSAWVAAVQANAQAVTRVLTDNPQLLELIGKHPVEWAKNIALIARPSLILADHLASALKAADRVPGTMAYANTVLDKYENAVMADTLPVHLLKTRYAADPFFKGLCSRHKPLPVWHPPKDSLLYQTGGPARFRWQDDAAALVRAVPGIADRPFMAMVVSSTGAGKTLGAPKVLAAASGDCLRYTCALGLRSLTLQTGAAYRTQLGLSDGVAMTVVGDALYAQLTTSPEVPCVESMGSESLAECLDYVLDGAPTGEALANALEFASPQRRGLASSTALAMAEVPVLTCTVDHIMGAATLAHGTDTRMSLRLATADLVLDEIDNYSLEDLQALVRLVHAAGCYGRRVVLMSATVSEMVLATLHEAWISGLQCWALRTGNQAQPVVALVSNQTPSEVILDSTEVATALPAFIQRISTALARETPKTKATEVPVASHLSDTFQQILNQAIAFARAHHTVDPATGRALSAGFVRFNKVRHCRQFARFVMDSAQVPNDVSLKVQCYHRRMPLFHLAHIEKTLNALWARQDEYQIFRHPVIAAWNTTAPLRLILVATTSIQETGRDHDYDFAITEPWSTRSLVQLAGRVRRHRGHGVATPNIGVLTRELSQLDGTRAADGLEIGREEVYSRSSRTGVALRAMLGPHSLYAPMWAGLLKQHPALLAMPPVAGTRTAWLPHVFYTHGIDARPCLSPEAGATAALPYLEHFAQELRMRRPAAEPGGQAGFFSAKDLLGAVRGISELLWGRHAHVVQFRRQSAIQSQFTLNPSMGFRELAVVQKHPDTGALLLTPRNLPGSTDWRGGTCIKNLDRVLVRTDELTDADIYAALGRASARSAAARLSHSFEAYVTAEESVTQPLYFDPLLGADTHSSLLS